MAARAEGTSADSATTSTSRCLVSRSCRRSRPAGSSSTMSARSIGEFLLEFVLAGLAARGRDVERHQAEGEVDQRPGAARGAVFERQAVTFAIELAQPAAGVGEADALAHRP